MTTQGRPVGGPAVDHVALFRQLPTSCMVLDRDLLFVEVDDAYPATVGRTREELLGMPPVLRLPDGELRVLDQVGDLLLGLDGSAVRSERLTELPTGSTVVLFTDGLVERRDASIDIGVERVVDALVVLGDADPEATADAVVAAAEGTNEDDLAVLVVRTR